MDDGPTAKKKRRYRSKTEKQEDLSGEKLGEGDMQGSLGSLKLAIAILEIDLSPEN